MLGDSRLIVTISGDREPFDPSEAFPWSHTLGIEWRWVDADRYRDLGLAATALQRFTYRFDAPSVLMLDADVLCCGELGDLPQMAGDGIAGLIAHVSPESTFAHRIPRQGSTEGFWADLYRFAGLPAPELTHRHTGWGLMDQEPGRQLCPAYFNLGVLAAPGPVMNALGAVIFDELDVVEAYGQSYFRPQLALALAIARTGFPVAELPIRFNFPNDERFWDRYAEDAKDVRLLHYLRRHEVDRDQFLSTAEGFERFLARRRLSPANALLQSRMTALRGKLGAGPEWPSDRDLAPRFPFIRPETPPVEEWAPYLTASYAEQRFTNRGPLVRRLESELTDFVGAPEREAVLTSSATAGLAATLIALGVRGPVAMPAFTFPATAHAAALAGCTPIFCDVDPETWELDPVAVLHAVQEHGCAAIMHVRTLGLCRDLAEIETVAHRAGVPLIVDSAAAFGGGDEAGLRAGGAGDAEIFSFHATKPFAVGEGGAVLARSELADRVREVINFSLRGGEVMGRGMNGKMSELSAAVGLATMRRFDEQLEARRLAAERLTDVVGLSGVAVPPLRPGSPPWQCLPVRINDPDRRDPALRALAGRGIEARTYYAPGLHRTRAFGTEERTDLRATDELSARILCLPVYADLESAERDELVGGVGVALNEAAPVIMQR